MDGVINPQNNNFNQYLTRKIVCSQKRYESNEVDRRTWLHAQKYVNKSHYINPRRVKSIHATFEIHFYIKISRDNRMINIFSALHEAR